MLGVEIGFDKGIKNDRDRFIAVETDADHFLEAIETHDFEAETAFRVRLLMKAFDVLEVKVTQLIVDIALIENQILAPQQGLGLLFSFYPGRIGVTIAVLEADDRD